MSYPRPDWTVRAGANFKSLAAKGSHSARGTALREWIALADCLDRAGATLLIAPPPPHLNLTGLPFTAEAGALIPVSSTPVSAPEFFLANVTPAHRQEERTYLAGFLAAIGWKLRECGAKWEGQGDLLQVDERKAIHTYGIGPAARTSQSAYAEIAPMLPGSALSLGFRADPWFHGNTFLNVFRAKPSEEINIMLCPEALLPGERERLVAFLDEIPIHEISRQDSEAYATNALQVGETVIAPAGLSSTIHDFWKSLGLKVVEQPFTELFGRAGGAAVCLTNRLLGIRPDQIPAWLTYPAQRDGICALI